MIEEWRQVAGWPGYFVSSFGRVRGPRKLLGLKPRRKGYVDVTLRCEGDRLNVGVHSLVAQEFLGPRPQHLEVDHKDGDKSNNRVDNLEYVTSAENHARAVTLGLKAKGESHGRARLNAWQVRIVRRCEGLPQQAIADVFGVSRSCIQHVREERSWQCS